MLILCSVYSAYLKTLYKGHKTKNLKESNNEKNMLTWKTQHLQNVIPKAAAVLFSC